MSTKRRRILVPTPVKRGNIVEDDYDSKAADAIFMAGAPMTSSSGVGPYVRSPPAAMNITPTPPNLEKTPKLVLVDLQKEVDAVVEAMKLLYELLNSENENSAKHKREANLTGAPGVIVRAMRKWRTHHAIQVRGCNCLRRLSYQNVDGVCAIAQSGGVEAIVDAMKTFPLCPYVQNRAIGALYNTLSVQAPHPAIVSATYRFVVDLNGLDLLLAAMKGLPNDSDVHADCCALFYNLAQRDEMKTFMAMAGVVSAVAATWERHFHNEEVKEQVDIFMSEMFSRKRVKRDPDQSVSLTFPCRNDYLG